ncbi:hypothetical protein SOVF_175350 [Spinacia oleracea]|uniref:WRKY transcription factor 72B n=1 Tax=Spinacia oleracea TaxID=3562 RepID=A0A9R0I7Q7_SPIOL|nr:WRKY transcription factor 72B [Spinacia oleracea]KNA07072.1 hypothetical protein SOVF_175350 [Spinacia oleracea]
MGETTEINDCWSLLAVVKECARKAKLRADQSTLTATTTTTATTATTTTTAANHGCPGTSQSYSQNPFYNQFVPKNNSVGFMLPSAAGVAPAADGSVSEDELTNLYKPFLMTYHGPVISTTIKAEPVVEVSGINSSNNNLDLLIDQQNLHLRNFQISPKQSSSSTAVGCIYKKKKFEDRRVVKYTLEELSKNDKWAWRKYGQKPIKGSPYPRNYYRCSSIKGCKARKQVERSPIDPLIYIVTYTDHHHHPCPPTRNSSGPRVKITMPDPIPSPKIESPTSIVPVPKYGYGLSGNNGVKIEFEDLDGEKSFGSGSMDEDHDISMADSGTLTGMEQLNGGGKCPSPSSSGHSNSYYYNENHVGYYNKGCDPNVKMEVQLEENGLSGYDIGIREMYGSAPATLAEAHEAPSNMGRQNIWGNGVNKAQTFFF